MARRCQWHGHAVSVLELPPGETAVDVEVPLPQAFDHRSWKSRRRGLLVPSELLDVVAPELLVERRLRSAGTVGRRRPEPRGVGGQRFVAQREDRIDETEL